MVGVVLGLHRLFLCWNCTRKENNMMKKVILCDIIL